MTLLTRQAQNLERKYWRRAEVNVELGHCKTDLAGRQTFLIPPGGWLADQGKSTIDQRKAAAENAYATDEVCQKINQRMAELADELLILAADIDGTLELSKAERWNIRKQLASVLETRQIPQSDDAEPGDDGFDDALDHALDEAVDAATSLKFADGSPVSVEGLKLAFPSEPVTITEQTAGAQIIETLQADEQADQAAREEYERATDELATTLSNPDSFKAQVDAALAKTAEIRARLNTPGDEAETLRRQIEDDGF